MITVKIDDHELQRRLRGLLEALDDGTNRSPDEEGIETVLTV